MSWETVISVAGRVGVLIGILQLMRNRRTVTVAPPQAPVVPATPSPEPEPYFITDAELRARVRDQRTSWEFKAPTPEGALRKLQENEGWERDEIDGNPVVIISGGSSGWDSFGGRWCAFSSRGNISSRLTIPPRAEPQWRARSSAHRFLHERADPCLFGGSQLLQREGDRPHGAFVEVRRVAEA